MTGDSSLHDAMKEALWADFVLVVAIAMFKDYCMRQDDPKKAGEEIIAAWRERAVKVISYGAEESEKAKAACGASTSLFLPGTHEVMGGGQDCLNEVEATIRRIVNL